MAGCRSLSETEGLTEPLHDGAPDASSAAAARGHDGAGRALRRVARRAPGGAAPRSGAAWRRKALAPVGLPVSVVALDGKATALPCINGEFAQTQHPEQGLPYGIVRTMTCALVSAAGRPCIDAVPIPAETNEAGHFQTAFKSLVATYGELFDAITYDAGGFSRRRRGGGRGQGLPLRAQGRAPDDVQARRRAARRRDGDRSNRGRARQRDRRRPLAPAAPRRSELVLRRRQDTPRVGLVARQGVPPKRLTTAEWMPLVRSHWGVENQNHHTFDTAFVEDDRPWIEADEHGMLAVLLLRRIAYTLLALFRAASRTDDGRAVRWRALLTSIRDVLVAATEEQLAGLREITAATR